jgi:hypothetical protein
MALFTSRLGIRSFRGILTSLIGERYIKTTLCTAANCLAIKGAVKKYNKKIRHINCNKTKQY